jgi:hypothetical protein
MAHSQGQEPQQRANHGGLRQQAQILDKMIFIVSSSNSLAGARESMTGGRHRRIERFGPPWDE